MEVSGQHYLQLKDSKERIISNMKLDINNQLAEIGVLRFQICTVGQSISFINDKINLCLHSKLIILLRGFNFDAIKVSENAKISLHILAEEFEANLVPLLSTINILLWEILILQKTNAKYMNSWCDNFSFFIHNDVLNCLVNNLGFHNDFIQQSLYFDFYTSFFNTFLVASFNNDMNKLKSLQINFTKEDLNTKNVVFTRNIFQKILDTGSYNMAICRSYRKDLTLQDSHIIYEFFSKIIQKLVFAEGDVPCNCYSIILFVLKLDNCFFSDLLFLQKKDELYSIHFISIGAWRYKYIVYVVFFLRRLNNDNRLHSGCL